MNSEKVKEIKKALGQTLEYCARELERKMFQYCLTLINELENEKSKLDIELDKRDCIDYPCRLIEKEELKQFAERLKAKMSVREYMGVKYKQGVFSENEIDETLKEFGL